MTTITTAIQSGIDGFMRAIDAANSYRSGGEYDSAVEAYKAAGNAAASTLGPAIDESTGGKSAALTHNAWAINGELAQINSGPFNGTAATSADADKAFSYASQMYSAYHQALYPPAPRTWFPPKPAASAAAGAGGAAAVASAPAAPKSSLLPLLGGALIGGAIGGPFGMAAVAIGAIVGGAAGAALSKKNGGAQ